MLNTGKRENGKTRERENEKTRKRENVRASGLIRVTASRPPLRASLPCQTKNGEGGKERKVAKQLSSPDKDEGSGTAVGRTSCPHVFTFSRFHVFTSSRFHVFTLFRRAVSLLVILGLYAITLHAQTEQPTEEERLSADLPEVIRAEIIDTTRVFLSPRARFNDPSEPQLISAASLYAKERFWNLPPILTPQRIATPQVPTPKSYALQLTAYPSLPEGLFYDVLLAGEVNQTRGYLALGREQLGDERTKGRNDYNVDRFRGGFNRQYQELSEFGASAGLRLKSLEWLSTTPQADTVGKDLLLLDAALDWKQQVSETTWSTLHVDVEQLRFDHADADEQDNSTNAHLNLDLAASWPFLNPIHVGGDFEYLTAENAQSRQDFWSTFLRFYVRDAFTPLGPFVVGLNGEVVSFRERSETDEDQTRVLLNPGLTLTTKLGPSWRLQLLGNRTVSSQPLSTLYFDTDYISLNPFLRPEKRWEGQALVKHHRGTNVEVNMSMFARQHKDLFAFARLDDVNTVTWMPVNIDATIIGGQLEVFVRLSNRIDLWLRYVHEEHNPDVGEQIPYRPADTAEVDLMLHTPGDFHVSLRGAFMGKRYIDANAPDTLDSYFRFRPKISKTVQRYVDVFIGGAFTLGDYQLLDGYELSQGNFDFGLDVKF